MLRLAELSSEEALIVEYMCNDSGAIDLDKSYRLLARTLLELPEVRLRLVANIIKLEEAKLAKQG